MKQLQDALDRSMHATSDQTRSFFVDAWTAEQVVEFVDQQRNVTIATCGPTGFPHAAVVIARCFDGVVHFTVTPGSILHRNLTADDRIGFSVTDRSHAVLGQGRARRVGAAPDLPELGSFAPAGWTGDIYAIEVSRVFAN